MAKKEKKNKPARRNVPVSEMLRKELLGRRAGAKSLLEGTEQMRQEAHEIIRDNLLELVAAVPGFRTGGVGSLCLAWDSGLLEQLATFLILPDLDRVSVDDFEPRVFVAVVPHGVVYDGKSPQGLRDAGCAVELFDQEDLKGLDVFVKQQIVEVCLLQMRPEHLAELWADQ